MYAPCLILLIYVDTRRVCVRFVTAQVLIARELWRSLSVLIVIFPCGICARYSACVLQVSIADVEVYYSRRI